MTPPTSLGRSISLRSLEEIQAGVQVGWVRSMTALALLGYLVSFISEFTSSPEVGALVTEGITILILAAALWIAFRFSPSVAAFLTVAVIFLELHTSVLLAGSIKNTVLPVFPVLVAGSGILLGGRAALVTGTVSGLSIPLAVGFGRLLNGDLPVARSGDFKVFATQAVILVAMALVISLFLKEFGRILEAARRNERRLADLVEGNPDGIIGVDADRRIDTMNPAAEKLLGVSRDGAMGRRLEDLTLGKGARLTSTKPVNGAGPESLPVEQKLTRQDGTQVWVEVVRKPMTRPDGSPGMILVLRDLTQRREMVARSTQLGKIVEEAQNEIYVFNRDTLEILMANRGARTNLGYPKEEILGKSMAEIQPTLTPEGWKALARRLVEEDEGVVTFNTIHHRKDGSVYPLEVQFQRGFMEGAPAILAFGVDITERERAHEEQRALQAQLQHAQKMEAVGLLAGGVAHDFNNLLTVIGGCGEILLEVGDDEVRSLTQEILESQQRGAALTQQLLAFARREIVQPEDLSLPEVVQGMEALIRRVLGERIRLDLVMEEDVTIRADRGQLEQVILNLAGNSKDAMPGGGTLTIRVTGAGPTERDGEGAEFATLSVEDTGEGMAPATVERMFEPFYTTKPRGKGTGLGLSTVQGIVSQNGGRIGVESVEGEGTSIRILWPLPEGEVDLTVPEKTGEPSSAAKATILVAEDEDGALTLIRTVLEREGYGVLGVRNGQEALAMVENPDQVVDLLLTDIVMPGIGGLELAEKVKKRRPELPILFMSGYIDAHLQGPEGSLGSLNLLNKPFRPPELRRRVAEVLERK